MLSDDPLLNDRLPVRLTKIPRGLLKKSSRPRVRRYLILASLRRGLQPLTSAYAPNLSNIRALACINRIRYLDSKTPSDPRFEPVSVKRSSLSEPDTAECSSTGGGCQEWPFIAQGVE